ncbi:MULTISPECIES: AfsA-related hotdog domain-containing protein [Caballeronia]|uniref:AfsA-related hotdog domain-containing protein n=1 Tax=Caballeronia jiangsuensis TaxID=1458357 RepID=A0ABW9CV82_9BURK|nr:AfsA-related hotdog domain-containing protein [Caballeronia sp. GaOx3]
MTSFVEKRLDFERTLPISLVHKPSNDLVMLTDYVALSRTETLLGAQVSRSHGLYQESILASKGYDIAALVEICRQACFVVAHTQFGLSLEENRYQFLFRELESHIEDEALRVTHPIGQPIRIVVRSSVEKELRTEGRTSGLTWRYDLSDLNEGKIATVRIQQSFVDRVRWKQIRREMCDDRGMAFQSPIEIPAEGEIGPAEVARWNPQNVTLLQVSESAGSFHALARFDPRHPVLFDRPTADHIFAMMQLESCRQLALYTVARTLRIDAFALAVSSCNAVFMSMCEVNLPVRLRATLSVDHVKSGRTNVDIQLEQQSRIVSRFKLDVQVAS